MASSFEAAVSAAASVGVHVAREGLSGQFVTDSATLRGGPLFADALLDSLAVIHSSAGRNLDQAMAELRTAGGVVIAIVGRLSAPEARKLAACRSEGSQGLAIVLDAATWAVEPQRADAAGAGSNGGAPAAVQDHAAEPPASKWSAETAAAESILLNAGWRVTVLDAATPLAVAWRRLSRSGAPLSSRVWVVPGSAGPAALQGAGGPAPSGTAIAADGGTSA
jgi:hypothetical protein